MPLTFRYKITLLSGLFAFADNGIELDRIVAAERQFIHTIEVVDLA